MGTDLLALRKKSSVTKFLNERFLPANSMPGWEQLSLGDKLPNPQNPFAQTVFTRAKLGQKLYNLPKKYFDLTDTNVSLEYEPLHDVTLREYFNRDPTLNVLKRHELVDDHGKVKCSLKDFNAYRRYLYDAHLSRFHDRRLDKDKKLMEKLYFKMAQKYAENIKKGCHREKKFAERRNRLLKTTEENQQANMRKWSAKLSRSQKKISINQKPESRTEYTKTRRLKETQTRVELQEKLKVKERLRLQMISQRDESLKQIAHEKSIQHWNHKLDAMRKTLRENESLQQMADSKMATSIQKRHTTAQKQWSLIEANKLKFKMSNIRNRYETSSINKFIRIIGEEFRRMVVVEEIKFSENYNTERKGLSPIVEGSGASEIMNLSRLKYPVFMTQELVSRAVHTCVDIYKALVGNDYCILNIIQFSKLLMCHIAAGISEIIPSDNYAMEFVKGNIRRIITSVIENVLEMIRHDLYREHQQLKINHSSARKSILYTQYPMLETPRKSTKGVQFQGRLLERAHKQQIGPIELANTTMITMRALIRAEFETDADDLEAPMDFKMDSPEIFHLNAHQKEMISAKLINYHKFTLKRIERLVFKRIDFKTQTVKKLKKQANNKTHDEMLTNAAHSVITPSFYDHTYCASTIVCLSEVICEHILEKTEAMMAEQKGR